MKIEVTEEHIQRGQRGHACKCPVALAATEAFGRQVYVHFDTIQIPDMDDLIFIASERIRQFTRDYDLSRPVTPFSFEVDMTAEEFVCR
jgi:hypothetical protein